MSRIDFDFYKEEYAEFNSETLSKWIEVLVESHQKRLKGINYHITTDEKVLEVNRLHLNHDYYTDIITFNYNKYDFIAGDVYISYDRIQDFSRGTNLEFKDEYLRVLAHGCLHLIGFDDKTDDQKLIMREEEDKAIEIFKKKFHEDVPRETK